jgi:hypothetical protein
MTPLIVMEQESVRQPAQVLSRPVQGSWTLPDLRIQRHEVQLRLVQTLVPALPDTAQVGTGRHVLWSLAHMSVLRTPGVPLPSAVCFRCVLWCLGVLRSLCAKCILPGRVFSFFYGLSLYGLVCSLMEYSALLLFVSWCTPCCPVVDPSFFVVDAFLVDAVTALACGVSSWPVCFFLVCCVLAERGVVLPCPVCPYLCAICSVMI